MINIKLNWIKPETSRSCGIACIRMILDFYGTKTSERQLFDNLQPNERSIKETNLFSLGNCALKHNLNAKYIGYDPYVFSNLKTKTNLRAVLVEKIKTSYDKGKFCREEALKFIELNGEVVQKIPTLQDINLMLEKHIPVMVGIRPIFVDMQGDILRNHFIIIKGYDKNKYYILDPAHGEYEIESATLIAAIYTRRPEILIITKKT